TTQSTTTQSTTTQSTTAQSTTMAPSAEVVPRSSQTFVRDALAELPVEIRSAAVDSDQFGAVRLSATSFDLAAHDAGIGAPADASSVDDGFERFKVVANWRSVEQGGNGYALLDEFGFPPKEALGAHAEVEDELGFGTLRVRSTASTAAGGTFFSVLRGDLPIASSLDEFTPGVFSTGDWPDGDFNMSQVTAARPFGRTLHLAERSDETGEPLLGVGQLGPLVERWHAEETGVLGDVEEYALVARILDEEFATSAVMVEDDFSAASSFDPARLEEVGVPISEQFSLLGFGTSLQDRHASSTVVYIFEDSDAAERALDQVRTAWTTAGSALFPGPVGERFEIGSVDRDDRAVVVDVSVDDDHVANRAYGLYLQGDVMFFHSTS
ncbi:hypothetical protein, partial [Ilumatobacter sp.]|uniref:hypothetical protein n=1 Tax=Ilumatobacter sp. TaxID=1967498 RepID=UPI003AF54022